MSTGRTSVRAWDLPVRLFHWVVVILVAVSVGTGLYGGNAMKWHVWSGYALLASLVFRLLWGLVGSSTARFRDFLYGPARMLAFARDMLARRRTFFLGHNPLGGAMVLVMVLCLLFQAGTGLFANDDIATEGPLYNWISKDLSDRLTAWHKLNIKIVYGLVALHVAAVLYHWLVLKENLVTAMFTGRKNPPPGSEPHDARFASPWIALALFAATAAGVWLLVSSPTL